MFEYLGTLTYVSDYIAFYGALVLAYLFGSIPWALIVGKIFYKTDIRQHGSGNLGGTNAGRVLGKKAGVAVTVLDALKAFFTVLFCQLFVPEASIYAGMLCCVGHCFPLFAGFKGGKAVATCFGYIIALSAFVTHHFVIMGLLPLASFFLCLYLCKMVSLSSMIALGFATLISFIIQDNTAISYSILILWLFVIYRHHANIKRIIKKEEKKITWM